MEFLKYILSQTPGVLMGILLFCIFAILFPTAMLNKIGLLELRDEYNSLLWVALFLSLSLLISHGLFILFPNIKLFTKQISNDRKRKKRLHDLSLDEKKILAGYIKKILVLGHFLCLAAFRRI